MIREGKRSIGRELVQFLEFLDGVSMKKQQLYAKSTRRVRFTEENEILEDEGISSDEQRELMESLCKKIENIEGLSRVYEDDNAGGQNGNQYFSAPKPVQMESDLMKREKIVRVAR